MNKLLEIWPQREYRETSFAEPKSEFAQVIEGLGLVLIIVAVVLLAIGAVVLVDRAWRGRSRIADKTASGLALGVIAKRKVRARGRAFWKKVLDRADEKSR